MLRQTTQATPETPLPNTPKSVHLRRLSNDELLCHLLSRAAPLRNYITQRMTPRLHRSWSVDDIFQEVCIEAFRQLSIYRHTSEQGLDSWMYFLAGRTLVNLLRQTQTRRRGGVHDIGLLEAPQELAASHHLPASHRSPTPSSEHAVHEAALAVHAALSDMPTRYSNALQLRYFGGLSSHRIAGLMGLTTGGVNRLLQRAENMLRLRLGAAEKYLSDA